MPSKKKSKPEREDRIVVKRGKYKKHTRGRSKVRSAKRKAVLKKHSSRNKPLNQLGSELNTIVQQYAAKIKGAEFYHEMQRCFRRTPSNNRFLLLSQLKGLDVNIRYPLNKLGYCTTAVQTTGNTMRVLLKSIADGEPMGHTADCYCFKVLLVYWDGVNRPPKSLQVESKWIPINGKDVVTEYLFKNIKGAVHWVLFVRQWLGAGEKWLDLKIADAMRIMEVGSFDKKDIKLLKEEEKSREL
jgi:hypothetical protein